MSEPKDPGMPQQLPTPDQANRDAIDFSSFQFQNIQWTRRNNAREARKNLPIAGNLKIGDLIFPFTAAEWQDDDGSHKEFTIHNSNQSVNASFTFEEHEDKVSAYAYIGRTDIELQEYIFPRNIG